MSLDTILPHSNEKSTTSILRDTNYTFAVTAAPAWHVLHMYFLRFSPEFPHKPKVTTCSHNLHSSRVFQPTLIGCIDPTSFRWRCLSPGQASQASPCLDAPDHQTNTVICLPISISVRLQSCSSISSTASDILKIFCLEPQGEWLPNRCHDFANGKK